MQASNFGGTFDQLSFESFLCACTEDASLLFLYHGAIKSKMTKNSIQGVLLRHFGFLNINMPLFLLKPFSNCLGKTWFKFFDGPPSNVDQKACLLLYV